MFKSPITRDNAWFDYRIRAVGNQVQTWINGVEMVQATLDAFPAGHFALQTHHKGNEIMYRDIQVRDISTGVKGAAAPAAGKPIRVVYCTESLGFRHEVLPETVAIMAGLGHTLDWLDVATTEVSSILTPETLAQVDVVVLYTTGPLPIDVGALVKWVEGGGALVGVHSATDTLSANPAYVQLIGGIFDGHPWNEEVDIVLNEPGHRAVKPFVGSATKGPRVRFADEIYQFKSLNAKNQILMSLAPDTPKAQAGRAYPLVWCREVGKGRMFYTALGHRPEVWRDQRRKRVRLLSSHRVEWLLPVCCRVLAGKILEGSRGLNHSSLSVRRKSWRCRRA